MHAGLKAEVSHRLRLLVSDADPHSKLLRLHPQVHRRKGGGGGGVKRGDSLGEFDPAVTLCSGHISPLLG